MLFHLTLSIFGLYSLRVKEKTDPDFPSLSTHISSFILFRVSRAMASPKPEPALERDLSDL